MNSLVLGKNPPVKSVVLKKRYAKRGSRHVHLQSLLSYFDALAASQNETAEK